MSNPSSDPKEGQEPELPHRPGLDPVEVENPGDPGPNVLVPPVREDPRTDGLPPVPEPAPGI